MPNPVIALGDAIGKSIEAALVEGLRETVEALGYTIGSRNLTDQASITYQIDAVVSDGDDNPVIIIESKYIRSTHANRDKGSRICVAHYNLCKNAAAELEQQRRQDGVDGVRPAGDGGQAAADFGMGVDAEPAVNRHGQSEGVPNRISGVAGMLPILPPREVEPVEKISSVAAEGHSGSSRFMGMMLLSGPEATAVAGDDGTAARVAPQWRQ